MMSSFFQKLLRGLQESPLAARRRLAIGVSSAITGMLFLLWLSVLPARLGSHDDTTLSPKTTGEITGASPIKLFRDGLGELSDAFGNTNKSPLPATATTTEESNRTLVDTPILFRNDAFDYTLMIPAGLSAQEIFSPELAAKEPTLLSRTLFSAVDEKAAIYAISIFKNNAEHPLTLWVKEERGDRYGEAVLVEDGEACGLPAKVYTDVDTKKKDAYFLRSIGGKLLVYAIESLRYEPENEKASEATEAFRASLVCI